MHSYEQANSDDCVERAMVDVRELLPVGQGRRGEFITQDAPIRRLLEHPDRVAKAPAIVLMTGENGTGKEVLAMRLHERSPRHRFP